MSIRLDCDAFCRSRDASDFDAELKVHMLYSAAGTEFETDVTAGRVVRKDVSIDGTDEIDVGAVKMALVGVLWDRMARSPILQATLRDESYADAVRVLSVSGVNASAAKEGRTNMTVAVRITGYGLVAEEAAERIRDVLDGDGGDDADVDSVAWNLMERLSLYGSDSATSPSPTFASTGSGRDVVPSPSHPSGSANSTATQNTQQESQNSSSKNGDSGGGRLRHRQLFSLPGIYLQRQRPATIEQSVPHGDTVPANRAPSSTPTAENGAPLSSITVRISLLIEVTDAELQSETVRASMAKSIASALDLEDVSLVNVTSMYRCGGTISSEEDPRCAGRRRNLGEDEFRRSLEKNGFVHVEFQISGSESTVAAVEDKLVLKKELFIADFNRAASDALTTALQRSISVSAQGVSVIARVREGEMVGLAPSGDSSGPVEPSVDYVMRLFYMGLGALFAVILFGVILLGCQRLRKRQKVVDDLGGGPKGKKDANASTYVLAPHNIPGFQRLSKVEVSVRKGARFGMPPPPSVVNANTGRDASRVGGGQLAQDVAVSVASTSNPPTVEMASDEEQPSQGGGTLSQLPSLNSGPPPVLYRL